MDKVTYILDHFLHPETLTDPEFLRWLEVAENKRLFEEIRLYREVFARDDAKMYFSSEEEWAR